MFELRWDNHKRQIDGVNHQIQIFLILKSFVLTIYAAMKSVRLIVKNIPI
jgi:hypothetical protein